MKIINIFINCVILKDVPSSTKFFVNDEECKYVLTKKRQYNLSDGFILIPYNFIKDIFDYGKSIELVSISNKKKSNPIIIEENAIVQFNKKIDKKFIPKIFSDLYENTETLKYENILHVDQDNNIFENQINFYKKKKISNDFKLEKTLNEFKSRHKFLNAIKLDNQNDKEFLLNAFKMFTFDLNFIFKVDKEFFDYYFNFKNIYYSIRILENCSFVSKTKIQNNIELIFDQCLIILKKFYDFIFTSYFQKSIILLLKLSTSENFSNRLIFKMYQLGLILILDKNFVSNELQNKASDIIYRLFYLSDNALTFDEIYKLKTKKINFLHTICIIMFLTNVYLNSLTKIIRN